MVSFGRALKITVLGAVCSSVLAASAQRLPDPVLERMQTVYAFAFGGVGIALETSPGEEDYRIVLARPSAEADFERLFVEGNNQAKCYALVGLRKINPKRFEELIVSLQLSRRRMSVMTAGGCLISAAPMAEIVQAIRAGIYPPAPKPLHQEKKSFFVERLENEAWTEYVLRVVASFIY